MPLDKLQIPEIYQPFVETNRTVPKPIANWIMLLVNYINRLGGQTFDNPDPVEVGDGEEISLESGYAGYGECMIGDAQEHCSFTFSSTGTIIFNWQTLNVANTDTASKLCVYWDASNGTVNIKNNLGSTLSLVYTVKYNNV